MLSARIKDDRDKTEELINKLQFTTDRKVVEVEHPLPWEIRQKKKNYMKLHSFYYVTKKQNVLVTLRIVLDYEIAFKTPSCNAYTQ